MGHLRYGDDPLEDLVQVVVRSSDDSAEEVAGAGDGVHLDQLGYPRQLIDGAIVGPLGDRQRGEASTTCPIADAATSGP